MKNDFNVKVNNTKGKKRELNENYSNREEKSEEWEMKDYTCWFFHYFLFSFVLSLSKGLLAKRGEDAYIVMSFIVTKDQ
jgi:hypothetical protein